MVMPWEPYEFTETRFYSNRRRINTYRINTYNPGTYERTVKHLSDRKVYNLRKGDLIKFNNGRCSWDLEDRWEDWFLSEVDYLKYIKNLNIRDKTLPLYAINQYGIIVGRYVIKKYKEAIIYRDYGSYIMMLTGIKKGYIRKYYTKYPFNIVSVFPYKKIHKTLNLFKDIITNHTQDSEECRNNFVSILHKKINQENFIYGK